MATHPSASAIALTAHFVISLSSPGAVWWNRGTLSPSLKALSQTHFKTHLWKIQRLKMTAKKKARKQPYWNESASGKLMLNQQKCVTKGWNGLDFKYMSPIGMWVRVAEHAVGMGRSNRFHPGQSCRTAASLFGWSFPRRVTGRSQAKAARTLNTKPVFFLKII